MSKFINDVNLNQNELQNAVIQPLSTAPASPKVGQVYFDTTDNNIYRWDGTEWKTYQSALDTTATSTLGIDGAPAAGSNNLVTSGGVYSAVNSVLPSQAGQSGKYLTTNGTSASWATVESGDSLPDQTGQAGKFLTTDGTDASWDNVPSYSFSNGLTESSSTVYNTGVLNVEASPSTASNGTVAVTKGTSEGGTSTSYIAVKGLGSAAYTDSSAYLPSSTTIPNAYTSNPAMDGTASPGSSSAYAKGDHVHPTDTTRQAKITASGILKGNGSGTITAAVAGTDYVASESDPTVPSWAKASSKPSYTATEVGAQPTITVSGLLKGNGSGTISAAVAGTDYQAPITNPITGTGQNKYLAKFNGTNSITSGPELIAAGDGKYLTHDGLWADPLPSRTGNSGKFLTTNGTAVSWANVSGVEYFTISAGVAEWTDFSATTFYNCYTSGKMPVVIDGDSGNIHFYPMSIATDSCIFEGITDVGNGYCTYGALFAYEDSSDNYIDTYYITAGSSVSYTPILSSGTKVGTLTINGTNNDIYAPTNTDVNVTQTKATYSSYTYWRPLTLGSSSNSSATGAFSTVTDDEYTFDNLRYQPSTGTLRTKVFNVAPTVAGTTSSNNHMSSDSSDNIWFRVHNGVDTVMTLYSNGTDMQVRPGGSYDDKVDLGKSTVRWKDAYLSGTVNAADYAGDITATTTVASGDKIIVHDVSASSVAGGVTFGSSTTQYLANDGSWQNIPSSGTQVSLVDWTV